MKEHFLLLSDFFNLPDMKSLEENIIDDSSFFLDGMLAFHERMFADSLPDPIIFTKTNRYDVVSTISDVEMNKKGLYLYRHVFSRYAAKHSTKVKDFVDKGILKFENFLPTDQVEPLLSEIKQVPPDSLDNEENLVFNLRKTNPAINNFFLNSGVLKIIQDCIGRSETEIERFYNIDMFVQRIFSYYKNDDEQKVAHIDTFFPTLKWWYFPEAVEFNQGTFCYDKDPKQTEKLYQWLYDTSIKVCTGDFEDWRGDGHKRGAFRINKEECEHLGIELEQIVVKPNTLIVANTGNFHSRGEVSQPHLRNAIFGSARISKPFTLSRYAY